MWSSDSIMELVAGVLADEEQRRREEQAVYGLDALDEAEIQPILAAGIAEAGLGVLREQPYPSQWRRKKREKLPLPRDRERCDLVLTPEKGQRLRDSLEREKASARAARDALGTLFERPGEPADAEPDHSAAPEDAYWLELKVVAQFSVESGVPGPNSVYGSQLTRFAAADVAKLSCDRTIVHGGLALVLFTTDERTAVHDSGVLLDRLITRGLRIASPGRTSFAILDRIGNGVCSVVMVPLRPAPPLE